MSNLISHWSHFPYRKHTSYIDLVCKIQFACYWPKREVCDMFVAETKIDHKAQNWVNVIWQVCSPFSMSSQGA